ncbi:AIG2-like protein [Xylaria venustula]|nr:AIG2-like protein [Xylaria venustula]
MSDWNLAPLKPRPLFIYGTLRALPLLSWALTGDASNISVVSKLVRPARVYGYARFALKNRDYPAVIKDESQQSSVDGYLLTLETTSQRKKLDSFEGEEYKPESVLVTVFETSERHQEEKEVVEANIYLWAGDANALAVTSWELESFEKEILGDWLDIFEGMELIGETEDSLPARQSGVDSE